MSPIRMEANSRGALSLLHQLEDGDDMPPLLRLFLCWRKVLGEELSGVCR